MTADSWDAWFGAQLDLIRSAGQWRTTTAFDALGNRGTLPSSGEVISFAGNDYLGLSAHRAVIEAADAANRRWGTGATASRLVVGTRPAHSELEAELAEWKGTERALVFASGYQANLGVLTSVTDAGAQVFSDRLNHASLIDGCRLSKASIGVYEHCDIEHLDSLLGAADQRCVVVTDTVFSMDGDAAPAEALFECCARHRALLVLDDAHSLLEPAVAPPAELDLIRVGTLSKTLGSLGGFVAASGPVIDLLVNRARSFIFTTGLPPSACAAASAALGIVVSDEGADLISRLRRHVDRLAPGHPSPIVPLIIGAESDTVLAASALLDRGLLVPAIRPPTVEPGTSRLRIALSAAHSEAMVDQLLAALDHLRAADLLGRAR